MKQNPTHIPLLHKANRTQGVITFKARLSWLSVFLVACSAFFLSSTQVSAQTTLAVGDLSVIGFNSNAPDNFAFVSWVPIANGTYIKFTDNAFLGTGSANATNNGRGGENFVIWQNNTGNTIAAGTVITIESLTTNTGVCTAGSASGLNGISNGGDQIFAYQGAATSGANPDWSANTNPTTFNGTILFGLNFGTNWLSAGGGSSNTSYLPSQLNVTNGNIALTTASTSRGQYTGSRSNQSSLSDYKALVNNSSNWTTATGNSGVITLTTTAFTVASGTITGAATASAFTTTYGAPSSAQTFAVSGSGLTASIVATAPTGFEVSRNASTYQDTVQFFQSGGTASGTLSVRLKATAAVTGSYNSQNIVLSSTGVTSVNIATSASGNSVTAAALTITGVSSNNKIYNASAIGSLTGTAAYSGLQNSESFSVTGTPVATFAQATVGTGIGVTVTGYTAPSTNYSVSQPSVANADITAKPLTISGLTADNKVFDGNTTATLSGTASLVGVETGDVSNVTLGGTYSATFASAAIGTGIAVTVTGYSLSGSAAGNYSLTQPTGLTADITSSPSPVINSSLTATETYGVGITTYTITATNTPTSFNAVGLPAGLSVNTSTGEITGTPTAVGTYTVAISATNAGGTGNANLVYTINPKGLTVTGATADTKEYNGTTDAVISGSALVGLVGTDTVTINNTGTFASKNVATGIVVTSTQTLGGAQAANYTLTQPTGLTADITAKALTISGITANNKSYDGNTTATLSGTASLNGVIAADVANVTLGGTPVATFASSTVGNAIAVTVTGYSISGSESGNYTLAQPTGLTANITSGPTTLAAGDIAIISHNTSGSPDNFTILVLKELAAGSVFFVSDNEIASAGGSTFTDIGEMEASFTVKTGQTIPAGTVINLPWGASAVSTTSYDWTSTSGAGFASGGDEIYIYTAPLLTSTTATTFIYYSKIGTAAGAIPAGLTSGSTAIAPSTTPAFRYSTTGALYTGCQTALLSAIGNTATNWNTTNATSINNSDWTFTVNPACASISSTGTLAALTTTYGTASSETSFNVSGVGMSAGITVTPPTGFEVSLTSGSGFASSVVVGAAGNITSTPVYVRLTQTANVAGSPYSGNIVLTSTGATNVNVATTSSTVSPLTITTTGATASNKVYNGTNAATITGATAVGAVNGDALTISGGGTFAQTSVGTGISVTPSLTVNGTNASSYTLTQPTGLTADITPLGLTITGLTADNKVYDLNTSATLSGTPTLVGVLAADTADVTLTGSYVATFATSNVGTGIAVTVTGYTLSGSAAGNYSLTQPTGLTADITTVPSPVISSSLTATETYGVSITTYTITASATPTSFNAVGLPAGLSVNTTTGEITGIPTAVGTYTVTISATNVGGTGNANLVFTIAPKGLTVTGATANTKVYNGTTVATISGSTLVGLVGTDTVTIDTVGTFDTKNVGIAKTVTSTQAISGPQAGNYTLTQPTGLTADVTAKALTITGAAAQNKVYDGNTTATLTGTLAGVISPDAVTLNLSGDFASSTIGNGIAVTSTSSLSGADAGNYTLTQPTGLTANITGAIIANWTYEPLQGATATPTPNVGTGTSALIGMSGPGTGTGMNTTSGCGAQVTGQTAWAISTASPGASNETNGAQFTTSTAGYQNINFTWEQRWSNTATNTVRVQYTTNGTSWSNFTMDSTNTTFCSGNINVNGCFEATGGGDIYRRISVNLSSVTAANNNPNFGVRVVAAHYQSTGQFRQTNAPASTATGGTWRFDNVRFEGVSGAFPTISSTGTLSALSTTYGTASIEDTFNVSGAGMTAGITVTPPTGYEVSLTSGSGFAATVTAGAAGTIASTPVYVRLTASATPASYSGNIVLSSTGATSVNVATVASTVSAKQLTVTGATASNKVYDSTNAAIITGSTLVGIVGSDVVTINGTGTFASANVGTAVVVTSTQTLGGANASNYTLAQPTGLTADITPLGLTITGLTADNRIYDMNDSSATLSGTATLVGVLAGDTVILGGTPIATFAQAAIGTGIAVTVTGYTLSGSAAGNYTLSQPTGLTADITSSPTPVINSSLTATETYGVAITTYSITATNTPTSFNAVGLPAGLSVNTTTGEITGTPSVVGTYTVAISATNVGGTGNANLVYTINPKGLTVTGATANTKVYDGTTVATISGSTLVGLVGTDTVYIDSVGTFDTKNAGTSKTVTSTQAISGPQSGNYSLTQPTGLSADVTAKELTIAGAAAQNKIFDGNIAATITGTLSGVVAPDVVSLTLSGTFASSAIGTGIIVTSTSTIGGADSANYTLTQPTGLTANITAAPAFTEVIFPQYIQGLNGTNNNRIPFAYRATVSNLNPNATYRFYNSVELTSALPSATGAGNNIYTGATQGDNFSYSTGPSLSTVGNYGSFTTDSNGAYTGWFIIAPSGNATRFVPGTILNTRIVLNNGNNGTAVATILKSNETITVINTVGSAGANNGTGLWGASSASDKNFVFVYDTVSGSNRPLSGTFVENDGAAQVSSFASFYTTNVNGTSGRYGMIVPNTNSKGVRRIEQRSFSTGAIVGCPAIDSNGVWPSGANTVNPTGGTTAIAITSTDAPLNPTCSPSSSSATVSICADATPYMWNSQSLSTSGVYTFTTVNSCGCDSTATLNLTINALPTVTASSSPATICAGATSTLNGGGATSYTFSGGSASVTPASTTTYTITGTDGNSCSNTTTVDVTVNALPTVTASASATTLCSGDSLTLTGGGATSYTWSDGTNTPTNATQFAVTAGTSTYTVTGTDGNSCSATSTVGITVTNCSVTLNLTAYIQGYYGSVNAAPGEMAPVLNNAEMAGEPTIVGSTLTQCDTITVELRDESTYAVAYTFKGILNTNGTLTCTFPGAALNNSYYIALQHRNALETWSAIPVLISSTTNYNFSSSASQAYNDNQIEIATGVFAIYSGDIERVNGPGVLDFDDSNIWESDYNNFGAMYIPTDLNGDGTIDFLDINIWESNYNNFISVQKP